MGYKKVDPNLTFAELSLMGSMEHNRSLKLMEKIDHLIDWSKVETLLMNHYTVGTSIEGADAYPHFTASEGNASSEMVQDRIGSGIGESDQRSDFF